MFIILMLLVVVPLVLQLFAINVYAMRLAQALRRSAHALPCTTSIVISALGPQPQAVAALLDRTTRLDPDEIDSMIAAAGGQLPLPMSRAAAYRLVQALRQLGAVVAMQDEPDAIGGASRLKR